MNDSSKVALITGGASGLGMHISRAFLEKGYHITINYLKSAEEAQKIISDSGNCAISFQADVGNATEVRAMITKIEETFGRLDILINNAGIAIDSLLIKQTEEQWDTIIRTNLTGCFNLIRAAAPLMISSGGGHIINILSYSGVKGKAGQAAYSASKAGLVGLTITAALELAEHNIRVNAVMPGYMNTGMGSIAMTAMKQAKEESVLKRLSNPSEVAQCIAAIAEMNHITGQVFNLDSRIL